jgi:diacylglycerol kinase
MHKNQDPNLLKQHMKSYKYALRGLYEIFTSELNFKILLACSIVVVVFGFVFDITTVEWIIVIFTITLLLISEAFNKSIETACDAICIEYREHIRFAKDVAAGAVLLVAILSAVVIGIIFVPYIVEFLNVSL